jgi:hypothetical protein
VPLSFQSLSHGPIAFGFFNIDTDMLILEHHFFFAPEFCRRIIELSEQTGPGPWQSRLDAYTIEDPSRIGDLMGAIHNIRHIGFIGDVYRRFPFPLQPEAFKQKPEGFTNREEIKALMEPYAALSPIPLEADPQTGQVRIGHYVFSNPSFRELILYVWVGGYPRWRNAEPPETVRAMKSAVQGSENPVVSGLEFDDSVIPAP